MSPLPLLSLSPGGDRIFSRSIKPLYQYRKSLSTNGDTRASGAAVRTVQLCGQPDEYWSLFNLAQDLLVIFFVCRFQTQEAVVQLVFARSLQDDCSENLRDDKG
jgi:hypothetical protein